MNIKLGDNVYIYHEIKSYSYLFVALQQKAVDDYLLTNYTSFKSGCCTAV